MHVTPSSDRHSLARRKHRHPFSYVLCPSSSSPSSDTFARLTAHSTDFHSASSQQPHHHGRSHQDAQALPHHRHLPQLFPRRDCWYVGANNHSSRTAANPLIQLASTPTPWRWSPTPSTTCALYLSPRPCECWPGLIRMQLNDLVGFVVALAAYKVSLLELPHQ